MSTKTDKTKKTVTRWTTEQYRDFFEAYMAVSDEADGTMAMLAEQTNLTMAQCRARKLAIATQLAKRGLDPLPKLRRSPNEGGALDWDSVLVASE